MYEVSSLDINKPIYIVLVSGVILSGALFASALALHAAMPTRMELVYALSLIGTAVLILTPYLRVAVALGVFFLNREFKFAILSLLVLVMMVISFVAGLVFHIVP